MTAKVKEEENYIIVTPQADTLDINTASEFRDFVQKLSFEKKAVILDLSGVNFVDSTVFVIIFLFCKKKKKKNCRIYAAGINEQVLAVFRLVQMPRVLEICDTVQEAVNEI